MVSRYILIIFLFVYNCMVTQNLQTNRNKDIDFINLNYNGRQLSVNEKTNESMTPS